MWHFIATKQPVSYESHWHAHPTMKNLNLYYKPDMDDQHFSLIWNYNLQSNFVDKIKFDIDVGWTKDLSNTVKKL
jgi:hypothetical protein